MSPGASHLVSGEWIAGSGAPLTSTDPATGQPTWTGRAATASEVDRAVAAARAAAGAWADTSLTQRTALLEAFAAQLRTHQANLAEAICRETGKPHWEALSEVAAMIGKVPLTLAAREQRCAEQTLDIDGAAGATRYRPHGVLAVFGPFNMPGHLPNGHIVPALLAGNTVVFKPSEFTAGVGQMTAELWQAAGLPVGVLNLVQGGRDTGAALALHAGVDGVLFTGSSAGGVALARALADQPGKILALEMGGNNPLVAWDVADLDAAAYLIVQSAYLTAGQRCSCARRLIVPGGAAGEALLERLIEWNGRIKVGPYTDRPEPFMGPVISRGAAQDLLAAAEALVARGGRWLVEMRSGGAPGAFLMPGLIDVTAVPEREDRELFGPLLQVIRVPDFEAALAEANRTRYGLVAGLLSDRRDLYDRFYRGARAGVIHWNRQTTSASSRLPFGGVGASGNHRPSGFFAIDYCAYPVAVVEAGQLRLPDRLTPGLHA